ncbi:unnamed protein product [Ilex paraguariensis]|uniref:Uncharacterized protein n=1 Tax=Ilex paraguariensis TaxID=185542 RepID=A0ABC8ST06_9AQUA
MTLLKGGVAAFRIFNKKNATTQKLKLRIDTTGIRCWGEALVIVNPVDLEELEARLHELAVLSSMADAASIIGGSVHAISQHERKKVGQLFLECYRWSDKNEDLHLLIDKILNLEKLIENG